MLGPAVHYLAREEGVIVRGIRDLVAMSPPFVVTHAELERMFALLARLDRSEPDGGAAPQAAQAPHAPLVAAATSP